MQAYSALWEDCEQVKSIKMLIGGKCDIFDVTSHTETIMASSLSNKTQQWI